MESYMQNFIHIQGANLIIEDLAGQYNNHYKRARHDPYVMFWNEETSQFASMPVSTKGSET